MAGHAGRSVGALVVWLVLAVGCSGDPSVVPTATSPPATATTAITTTITAPTVAVVRGLAYDDRSALDVYVPAGSVDRPAAVVLVGNSFRGGYGPLVDALTEVGAVVVVASWDGEALPSLGNIGGAACALRFVRAHAAEFGIDPARITLTGHSKSAAVGALIALGGDHYTDDPCESRGVSAVPHAYLGLAGSYDPELAPGDPRLSYLVSDPDVYAALNPVTYVGEDTGVIVRLIHGDADEINPLAAAEAFEAQLRDAGYDADLTVLPGAGHGSLVSASFPEFEVTVAALLALVGT